MINNLSKDDRSCLGLKRSITSVGSAFRRRYAWMVGIICLVIGGGVIAAVNNLTTNATKSLIEDENLLDQSKDSMETAKVFSGIVDDEYEKADIESLDDLEGKTPSAETLTRTVKHLQLQNHRINSLEEVVNSILERQGISQPIFVKKDSTSDTYTIYIQYSQKDDESKMVLLQQYLKSKGYIVPAIEAVKNQQRDIRYFQAGAYDHAIKLRGHLKNFIKNKIKEEDFEIKVKDFSKLFPNAQKTSLELWLYF